MGWVVRTCRQTRGGGTRGSRPDAPQDMPLPSTPVAQSVGLSGFPLRVAGR